MMTLDEAIKHCEEVIKEKRDILYRINKYDDLFEEERQECSKCLKNYEQLAEWLKDYKRLRNKELAEQEKREAEEEARREAMRLDDNEDTLAYKGRLGT